jgi:hypothetical protein
MAGPFVAAVNVFNAAIALPPTKKSNALTYGS